jgi:hypothetical protein
MIEILSGWGESMSIARCEHKPYDVGGGETILTTIFKYPSCPPVVYNEAKLVREYLHHPYIAEYRP